MKPQHLVAGIACLFIAVYFATSKYGGDEHLGNLQSDPISRDAKPTGNHNEPNAIREERFPSSDDNNGNEGGPGPLGAQVLDLPLEAINPPIGKGLLAWQQYYDRFRHPDGYLTASKDGNAREWWMKDPEILAMVMLEIPMVIGESQQFFRDLHTRESAQGEEDIALIRFNENLRRYQDSLGAISLSMEWLLAQDPHSNLARILSNHLVNQARNQGCQSGYYRQAPTMNMLDFPLEVHVRELLAIDFSALPQSVQAQMVDSYASLLLSVAETENGTWALQGAVARIVEPLGFPTPTNLETSAAVHPDLANAKIKITQSWERFRQDLLAQGK